MRRLSSLLPVLLLGGLVLILGGCAGGNFGEIVSRPWAWGPCTLIIVVLDVIAFVNLAESNRSTGSKILWGLLIFFFPVGGLLLYYFFA